MIEIKWKRVHDYGCEPWRALDGDAGYDLCAIENTSINPFQVHRRICGTVEPTAIAV